MKKSPGQSLADLNDFFREIEPGGGESREKFPVPDELKQRITAFARRLQDKLMAGKNLTQQDLAPIARFKLEVETARLRQDIEKQYPACLETLDYFGFGEVPPPAVEKVMASFSLEMLSVARTFTESTLLLIPECSFKRKIDALNTHKTMSGQLDCYVDAIYKETNPPSTITGYRAVIVDGAAEMPKDNLKKGDDLKMTLTQRIAARKRNRRPHEKGMDRHNYALLMMRSLRHKTPVDSENFSENFTVLDYDPANSGSRVPGASWSYNCCRPDFSSYLRPGNPYDNARFRSSVGGDALL